MAWEKLVVSRAPHISASPRQHHRLAHRPHIIAWPTLLSRILLLWVSMPCPSQVP